MKNKLIDLTHTISANIPHWDPVCPFKMAISCDYKDCDGAVKFRTQTIATGLGIGTHMDAPAHTNEGGITIDQLALENLATECVVIKVDDMADEKYLIGPEIIEKFEKEYGKIQPNTFVIFYTGWSKHWNTPEKYRNNLVFPSVHEDTAKLLVERNIAGLGIDTLSADIGSSAFPVHKTILGAGKYLVENIANADQLPAAGAKIFVMPIKIKGATEAPIRLVAMM